MGGSIPPRALPSGDRSSCYNTPAIGADGTLAPGLGIGGGVTENFRSESDLNNTNAYSRYKCNNGWCAIIYGYYFESRLERLSARLPGPDLQPQLGQGQLRPQRRELAERAQQGQAERRERDLRPVRLTHP